MKQLIILLIEFALIVILVIGIYINNLSEKVNYPYHYDKPLMKTQLNLSDYKLKEELTFFLTKELGLHEGEFQILDAVYLYTNDISGADYILITLKSSDERLCQITVSRNFLPWAKWELNPKSFSVMEPLKPLLESSVVVPKWMQDLGVSAQQLKTYYVKHPDVALERESPFFDEKTKKFNLPPDWYQTVFTFAIQKDKTVRLIPDAGEKVKVDIVNSYWKADYPTAYLGLGYRGYLYKKIEDTQR